MIRRAIFVVAYVAAMLPGCAMDPSSVSSSQATFEEAGVAVRQASHGSESALRTIQQFLDSDDGLTWQQILECTDRSLAAKLRIDWQRVIDSDNGTGELSAAIYLCARVGNEACRERVASLPMENIAPVVWKARVEVLCRFGDAAACKNQNALLASACDEANARGGLGVVFETDLKLEPQWRPGECSRDRDVNRFGYVCAGGRGARAGFMAGDRVTTVAGQEVGENSGAAHVALTSATSRTPFAVTVLRSGTALSIQVE
jgi:hypothetical protein